MAVKTTFTNQELETIFADYHLGNITNTEPIEKGTVQTNYTVETTMGKFIFRYYENRTEDSVLFETDLLQYLKEHHFPCAGPHADVYGNFVGIYNAKPFAIFDFMEGNHPVDPNEKQKRELIATAALLHQLTSHFSPMNKESRWNYDVDFCLEQAQQAAQRIDSVESRRKLKWIERGLQTLILPKSLPLGICHADFDPSNILFKNDKLVALLDFDDANYTYLLFDVVGLIEAWAWTHDKFEVIHFPEAKNIIHEYMKHRQLTIQEKNHLFDVYKLSIFIDSVWFFDRGNADDFYEKKKIDFLDGLGREKFYNLLFN
ncbi:hypothetical protein A8F94_22670 [Bacillus sp. FJAT-27225]|uniref:homoserine kinase n=1 Tax=Bacillus sp. FJAT-27225 TaxID=1743144 RepID=UPI00080C3360|nr:homoserine kinase [Bacillus sp. FJAT-27225]OCA81665.1 hypothetical protein A8F94_22670 [Bacillus sp. FJAT-27225]